MAAQRGILAVWSNAVEARPLFEYVRASQNTARPIDMAGIDLQISAGGTEQAFVAELRAFAAKLADPAHRQQTEAVVEQTIAAHARITSRQSPPTTADFEVPDDIGQPSGGHQPEPRGVRCRAWRTRSRLHRARDQKRTRPGDECLQPSAVRSPP